MTRNALLAATPTRPRRRVSEVAGGTAADCAAVCCCCPCSVMNLLILTVYKVPRRLCIKAWAQAKTKAKNNNNKSKKKKKAGLLPGPTALGESEKTMVNAVEEEGNEKSDDAEAVFEKEMWDRFYGAGFWRTSSSKRVT